MPNFYIFENVKKVISTTYAIHKMPNFCIFFFFFFFFWENVKWLYPQHTLSQNDFLRKCEKEMLGWMEIRLSSGYHICFFVCLFCYLFLSLYKTSTKGFCSYLSRYVTSKNKNMCHRQKSQLLQDFKKIWNGYTWQKIIYSLVTTFLFCLPLLQFLLVSQHMFMLKSKKNHF